MEFTLPLATDNSVNQPNSQNHPSSISKKWMTVKEVISVWSGNNFTSQGILEHLNVTNDQSDYLWYFTRYNII